MSLPIITNFEAFDAIQDYEVMFLWNGNQAYGSVLEVYDNSTSTLVYTNETTSFLLKNIITASSLSNGTTYYCRLRVRFSDNTYSEWSSNVVFQCLSTPSISINISSGQIIQNSNYEVVVTYSQAQNEELNEWKLILYDSESVELLSTDYIYATSSMNYNLTGLENAKQYQIEIQYITVHGMTGTTGKITFSVEYVQPSTFVTTEVENICNEGQVRIKSNLISVDGTASPTPPTYIDDKEVDLTINKVVDGTENNVLNGNDVLLTYSDMSDLTVNHLIVHGTIQETGSGTKSSINPYTISGTKKITISNNDTISVDYNLPQELYDIDTYDFITGSQIRQTKKNMFVGTEDWVVDPTTTNDSVLYFKLASTIKNLQLCNYFNVSLYDDNWYDSNEGISSDGTYIYIKILKTTLSTQDVSGLKAWIVNHNVTLIYKIGVIETTTQSTQSLAYYHPTTKIVPDLGGINIDYTLTNYKSNAYVYFDKGFNIPDNFSYQFLARNFYPYQTIRELSNGTDTITIKYMQAIFDNSIGYQGYFLMEVSNGAILPPYRIATTPFTLLQAGQQVHVLIQRKNNLYNIGYKLVE